MPQLHLEYSANLRDLDTDKALLRLNSALVASGQFGDEVDIKSRAVAHETFRVGIAPVERAFVHVKLALLSGRSPEIKRQLSASLLEALKDVLAVPAGIDTQLCVEILDIDRDSYAKVRFPA
ncbi:5-carboxymethyl-2-hydroxymuconate Delta-isomerase [Pseudomonas putida CSV86]|uniref:5-carboxymethyl-2-hydroxymuconate Delta-isomerase n=1 Tax=Pseudomonas bharatica CSV86 TaxID=1005395 RepID=L1M0Z8_9PSED|nr:MULTISPECIES: 5-carboxymethyl-2-hydroxymuconate Delta-isomerase [Pseudomonas]MDG9881622.1 5-carboxymethyl-2-hydroxymuconate Delta-isomerase [Pseudomonas sp. GD04058]NNJ16924.1 5-carboxymethyl-2-hydroxymuconate Delta-isomerase [Pseudomonas bharatica CSV86]